jgi:two-component system, cell cycle sensor histidine kinase and response regulator CckA
MVYLDFFSRIKTVFAREREDTTSTAMQVAAHTRAPRRLSSSKQRRLAQRYRVLVENAPVGIHEIDERRTLSAVNRAGLKMLGRTESVFGVPVLDVVSPADRPRISRLLDLAFAGEFCEFEFTGIGERNFLSCFMPLKDKHGAVHKLLGMSQDITHRKNAEKRLSQTQKMEALGKLAGGIAHDFNNTLNVIVGYAHLLQQPTPEKVQEHATEILKAAQQASSLTRQLLAFSRKQVMPPQSVDLNTVIESLSKMLRRLIREDIEIIIRLASDAPPITADTGQTEQIIMNLAINARDAMSTTGGRLTITTSKADLDETQARSLGVAPGLYAVLTISDEGHGINPETQVHLFEPFFTTKSAGEGTGLGLATVHAIVTQSGGHISFDSTVGAGTAFTIHFPASTTSPATMEYLPLQRPTVAGAETILLVEDEDGLRRLMKELLRAEGYTILESADGVSAIEISNTYTGTIHLLLTDIIMPRMQGHELARQLRQQRPDLKVLYVTGYAEPGTLEKDARVLEKPFIPEDLLRAIHAILAGPEKYIAEKAS